MTLSHPGLQILRDSINGATHCVGTASIPADAGLLFYQSNKDGDSARRIDLANASTPVLQQLMDACDPASFGRNDKDVLDESYRRAGKLDLSRFASKFELERIKSILAHVATELMEGDLELQKDLRAELYKLNVYEKGGFFKAHKDTPRGDNMFASLVVVFPTPHEGGSLVLRHGDKEYVYDSSKELASSTPTSPYVGYIAFYSDVEHEVLPITSGHRVTLTYNLYLDDKPPAASTIVPSPVDVTGINQVSYRAIKTALQELLADSSFLPLGGRLGFGLSHQYPYAHKLSSYYWREESKSETFDVQLSALKGRDAALRHACLDLKLTASIRALHVDEETDINIIVTHIQDMSDWTLDEPIWSTLKEQKGAQLIDATPECLEEYGLTLDNSNKVEWVTAVNSTNNVESPYIAYGNEASPSSFYLDLVLIVEVGEAGHRDV